MPDTTRALFGMETEYGVTAINDAGAVLPCPEIVERFRRRAATRPHLPSTESGVFFVGGRFYLDVGSHLEWATAECSTPLSAVRYTLAGDLLMQQLAPEVARDTPGLASLAVRKGNVDYATGATWASHENYLHWSPERLRPALVPHLVSRIVCTGSGGFDPRDPASPFVLSPRALLVRRVIDSSSPGAIALVDERFQPHCRGFHRQHLMCGDANCSHLSLFLRIGTTALVIALIEAGCTNALDVALADPLDALATVARDVTLRHPLVLASGGTLTALDIQRQYLARARAHRDRLPPWADAVCDAWQDVLDRLDRGGADAVADRLDWAIKLGIYRHRATRHQKHASDAAAQDAGYRAARAAELREIDVLFGQVSPPGLFATLDAAGVLRHRVAGIDDIDRALTDPPTESRARIRGQVIARLAGRGAGIVCAWDEVRDNVSGRTLDLRSPFADTEVWRDLPPTAARLVAQLTSLARGAASPEARHAMASLVERLGPDGDPAVSGRCGDYARDVNNQAFEARNAGRLEEAEWLMRASLAMDLAVRPEGHAKLRHRQNNLGVILLMRGRVAEARAHVALAWLLVRGRYDLTSARVLTARLAIALVHHEPCALFIGQLKTHLAIDPLPDLADVDRRWKLRPVLDVLAQTLDADAVDLLRAIGDVANGDRSLDSLDDIALWRDTPPRPLDAAWPAEPAEH